MPGANCSIYGCSTSRKSKGISIFKVPSSGNDEYNTQCREKIVNIITKSREIDAGLRRKIEARTLHTCELHYPEEVLNRNTNKTTLIPGSLPTLLLPVRSFAALEVKRSTSSIQKRSSLIPLPSEKRDCYETFSEFNNRINKLKLPLG